MKAAPANNLLVVDDEPDLRTLYELTLVREGYAVETAGSVGEAWAVLGERAFAAVITDMRLPDGTGLELLQRLERDARAEKTIVITAYGSAQGAVEALKCGAYDYLTKPVDLRQFRAVVASALGRTVPAPAKPPADGAAAADAAVAAAGVPPAPRRRAGDQPLAARPALQRLVGASHSMQQVHAMVAKVARSMAPVLVHGESGTGKELVARAVHELSARAGAPFIAVNCGAIPENLLEAEFFGYRKGAFTGAADDRDGFFQAAQGGTLFLDEIGDLPLAMQSKLLRVIQERAVRPVGAVAETPINVRIVSATHRDLGHEVQAGRFRQDLYYRLNVIGIRLPPLRERVADLPAICNAVLERIAAESALTPVPTLSAAALQRLSRHAFPGNVRELENLLQRALALSGGAVVELDDLGLDAAAPADPVAPADPAASHHDDAPARPDAPSLAAEPALARLVAAEPLPLPDDLQAHLDAVERDILLRALERYRYNRTAAGASLGLTLRQMRYRMARLGVIAGDGVGDAG
jgi:two-component system response regulator PilR (NtrC family)